MKAYELAAKYLSIAQSDDAFAGKNLQVGQSAERPVEAYPAVIFDCTMRPIGGSPVFQTYELMITVLSNPEDDDGPAHAALVEAVRTRFFGQTRADFPAVRAEVKALIEVGGFFRVLGRGHDVPADPQRPATEQSKFKTAIVFAGSVELL